jgi:hypothetical protein
MSREWIVGYWKLSRNGVKGSLGGLVMGVGISSAIGRSLLERFPLSIGLPIEGQK